MPKRTAGLLAALALAAALVFTASSASQHQASEVKVMPGQVQAERFMPIRFEYKLESALEKGLAAHIESANARLGVFLVEVRAGIMKDSDLLNAAQKQFNKTYLENPVLRMEGVEPVKGWVEIIPKLRKELQGMMYVNVHYVDAVLEYLPAKPDLKSDIDFRAVIRTRLACAPTDCTWLEGEACHRRVCTWEPCPGRI